MPDRRWHDADERLSRTMQHYRFCVALRRPDGAVDALVREEIITAETAPEAVLAAKRIHVDMIGTGTNAIYLTDAKGHGIWSLRLGDVWLMQADER